MFTKEITPIISSAQGGPGVVGTLVEYKLSASSCIERGCIIQAITA